YCYVLNSGNGALKIVDITTPAAPVQKGTLDLGALGYLGLSSVYVVGNYAYITASTSADFVVVDVTDKDKETSDFTGTVIVDIGVDKKAYIRKAWREKVTDSNLVDLICKEAPHYNPATINIESTKFLTILELMELLVPQKLRAGDIPDGYREFVKTLPHIISELKHRGRNKKVRIENMHGYVERGTILFPRTGAEDLIEELLRLGSWKTDDTADAFGYLQDVLVFPQKTDPERVFIVPEELKKTPLQIEKEEWEQYKEECLVGESPLEDADLW
ncbi:hypothetical protein LCGC14_2872130, partial [marine sediment metagenome]